MLNIALIGAGRIGHVHAKTIAAHPQATLALVCDPFGDAAEKLASQYGTRSCKDAEDVFADPEVDAVVIGSPTPLHIPTCSPPRRLARLCCARSPSPWT